METIEPHVYQKIDRFLSMLQLAARKKTPIDISMGFRCLVAYVIVDYAYREDFGGLSADEFKHPVIESGIRCSFGHSGVSTSASFSPCLTSSPAGFRIECFLGFCRRLWLSGTSKWCVYPLHPVVGICAELRGQVCARRIQRLKFNSGHGASPTIFDKLLNPHLNKGRPVPSQAHLTAEAILMSLAGTDTTANALVVGTYGVLNNEAVLKKLTKELREAVPDPEDTTSMTTVK